MLSPGFVPFALRPTLDEVGCERRQAAATPAFADGPGHFEPAANERVASLSRPGRCGYTLAKVRGPAEPLFGRGRGIPRENLVELGLEVVEGLRASKEAEACDLLVILRVGQGQREKQRACEGKRSGRSVLPHRPEIGQSHPK